MSHKSFYHADGSPILRHFIPTRFLLKALRSRAFFLRRQDMNQDFPDDGKLPKSGPLRGPLERSLGMTASELARDARNIELDRKHRFIMCWTTDYSGHMRRKFGHDGVTSELTLSELQLKRMVGCEWLVPGEFPPRPRTCVEMGGRFRLHLQVVSVAYGSDDEPFPIVANQSATAFKRWDLRDEREIRVEGYVEREDAEIDATEFVSWDIQDFSPLTLRVGSDATPEELDELKSFSANLDFKIVS